ncbi:MAG TPA: imidazolonepropionase [Trueperaceae bacterium]
MVDLLVTDIGELVTCRKPAGCARGERDLADLEVLRDAAVAVADGVIVDVGGNADLKARHGDARRTLSAGGRLVSPGLVDCHSHLLHGGSRHEEYQSLVTGARVPGKDLDEGIRYTVRRTREATDRELVERALSDLDAMLAHGTTTLEVKTGYGLDREQEERLLRLQAGLRHDVRLVRTFLGAHVVPEEYADDRAAYVRLVIELLDEASGLAEFCDVCCDPTAFTYEECRSIAEAALARGMRLKLHADQTGWARGTELAVELGATSVDHLDYVSDEAVAMLAGSEVVGVLLPAVTHHMLEMVPVQDQGRWVGPKKPFMPELARRLIRRGVVVALSCDYNPGTAPTLSMQATMQLASRLYRLSYAEVWHMSTINAAKALGLEREVGSVEVGKRADLVLWSVAEHGMVINRFGTNLVDSVVKDGRLVVAGGRRTPAAGAGADR